MAEIPDTIVLERDRDLVDRGWEIWVRRSLFALLPLITVLALFNVFGQRPATTTAAAAQATLEVFAPSRVRSGLLFGVRFHITAHRDLAKATLVLDTGWLEGMTLNTIEPSPVGEASDNGRLSLDLGHIPAGGSYILYLAFQVNPTNVGRRSQGVELLDGNTKLLSVDRSITVYP